MCRCPPRISSQSHALSFTGQEGTYRSEGVGAGGGLMVAVDRFNVMATGVCVHLRGGEAGWGVLHVSGGVRDMTL